MSKHRINRPNHSTPSLKKFFRERSKYLHESCQAFMVSQPSQVEPLFPYVSPGVTYDVGRNAEKRSRT